jgi:hypothetical protein
MSGSAKQIFHGITRAIFARLRKKASQLGMRVSSPRGQVEKDGVRIEWDYDASAQVLEVETKAPFWINAAVVNRTLRQEIEVTRRFFRAA